LGAERTRKKEEYFPDPPPLVRLNHRSDWADDECDTSFGFTDRGRDSQLKVKHSSGKADLCGFRFLDRFGWSSNEGSCALEEEEGCRYGWIVPHHETVRTYDSRKQ
jgi:hypothetical protein